MNTARTRLHRAILSSLQTAAALLAFGAALPANAQDSLPQQAESLATGDILGPFITEALLNNPALAAQDARFQAAKQTIVSAGALPNPRVQLTHFVESIQTRTGPQEQALSLQQPLPAFGTLNRKRDIARAQSRALWQAYAVQQFKLIDQISANALEIAFLEKAIGISKQNIELLERLESIAEDKVKSGGDLSDLLRIQVEIERTRDSLAKQQTQYLSLSAALDSARGRTPSGQATSIHWDAPAPLSSDPTQWLDAISQRSPQLAMLRSIEASQQSRERLAQLAKRPEFTLGLNYIRTGESPNPSTPDNGKDPWALMVGVSLPIWSKANNALSLQAALETEAINAEIRSLELTLLAEARSWIAKLEDSQSRIARYEQKLLPLARQSREISESSYQAGKASILELIDSDRSLLTLETEYWRAAADTWLARWKLTTLSGGLWLD